MRAAIDMQMCQYAGLMEREETERCDGGDGCGLCDFQIRVIYITVLYIGRIFNRHFRSFVAGEQSKILLTMVHVSRYSIIYIHKHYDHHHTHHNNPMTQQSEKTCPGKLAHASLP